MKHRLQLTVKSEIEYMLLQEFFEMTDRSGLFERRGALKENRHVNATKSYLHFDRFAGEAILCSNFFCFSLFLDVLFLS